MLVLGRRDRSIRVKAEIAEDLWHLEKIIKPGDSVTSTSTRKFTNDAGKSERKPVTVTVEVEKVEFHKPSQKLRVLGTITAGHPAEYVQIKQHHAIEVGPLDVISIEKEWHGFELDRLREAEKASKRPKLGVITIDDREAEVFMIREYGIESVGVAHRSGTGKYAEGSKNAKNDYYDEIFFILSHQPVEQFILCGPGFEKDNFYKHLQDRDAAMAKRMIVTSTNDVGSKGVQELVSKDEISKITQQHRYAQESLVIEELVVVIAKEKATYGYDKVMEALDFGAVDKLLVIDSLLFKDRDRIEALVDKAEKIRAKVFIISHENDASQKLEGFTGVAAILRFKVE